MDYYATKDDIYHVHHELDNILRLMVYTLRGYGCGNYNASVFVESKVLKQAYSQLCNCFSTAAIGIKSAVRNPQPWPREVYVLEIKMAAAEVVSIAVTGLKCGGCESNVKTKLNSLDGVLSVEASSQENKVDVEFDTDKISLDLISQAITEAGYSVD